MMIPQEELNEIHVRHYKELETLLDRKHTKKERQVLATRQHDEFMALVKKWEKVREEEA